MSFQKIIFSGDNPQPRFGHSITLINRNKALLYGGAVGDSGNYIITSDLFQLDLTLKKWKKIVTSGTGPGIRAAHTAISVELNSLLIYGGALGGQLSDSILYCLDTKNGQDNYFWYKKSIAGQGPGQRYGHCMSFVKPYVVIFGGNTGAVSVNDSWIIDITSKTQLQWHKLQITQNLPAARVYHCSSVCMAGDAKGMMVIFGGRDKQNTPLNDTWGLRVHRRGNWDWVKAPYKNGDLPTARYQHTSIFLGTLLLVIGGRQNNATQPIPLDIYDSKTSLWYKVKAIQRFRHTSWIIQSSLYVHGGFDQQSPNIPTDTTYKLQLTNLFSQKTQLLQRLMIETGKQYLPPKTMQTRNTNMNRHMEIQPMLEPPKTSQRNNKVSTSHKPVRLGPVALVYKNQGMLDDEKVKKIAIDQLPDQKRKLLISTPDISSMHQNKRDHQKVIKTNKKYNPIINSLLNNKNPTMSSISKDNILALLQQVQFIIQKQSTILQLRPPIKIFGTLYGQLNDLINLFLSYGMPTDQLPFGDIDSFDYLFLGNYVCYGSKSLQTILLLLALKLKYPEQIYLLRGSHQDKQINVSQGLGQQCTQKLKQDISLSTSVFSRINKLFQKLPLACIIYLQAGQKIFCSYGGISSNLQRYEDLDKIQRPIEVSLNPKTILQHLVYEILWGPTQQNKLNYNKKVAKFIDLNFIKYIIKAQQQVDGIEQIQSNIIGISSASDLFSLKGNRAGIITIKKSGQIVPKIMNMVKGASQSRWFKRNKFQKRKK